MGDEKKKNFASILEHNRHPKKKKKKTMHVRWLITRMRTVNIWIFHSSLGKRTYYIYFFLICGDGRYHTLSESSVKQISHVQRATSLEGGDENAHDDPWCAACRLLAVRGAAGGGVVDTHDKNLLEARLSLETLITRAHAAQRHGLIVKKSWVDC